MVYINDVLDMMVPTKSNVVSLSCWTTDGSVMHLRDVVCIRADFRSGTHLMKKVDNPSIVRLVRDYCIFEFKDEEVYI